MCPVLRSLSYEEAGLWGTGEAYRHKRFGAEVQSWVIKFTCLYCCGHACTDLYSEGLCVCLGGLVLRYG